LPDQPGYHLRRLGRTSLGSLDKAAIGRLDRFVRRLYRLCAPASGRGV